MFESDRQLFSANLMFRAFSGCRPSAYLCRLASRSPIFFEVSAFFQVAVTPMLESAETRSSILIGTCFAYSKFSAIIDFSLCLFLLTLFPPRCF